MALESLLVSVCVVFLFGYLPVIDGNVCDTSKFNVPLVSQFDLVLNALDNVEARRRVNRLCLAANVPLIEAGTTGYLGQVTVIHKPSNAACYECKTQETQKVYPICTIRSTPSMPVHTIVWAKELYKLLFHSKVEESMLFEDPQGEEPSTYMGAVVQLREQLAASSTTTSSVDKEALLTTIQQVLVALCQTEIDKQLEMGRYKTAKKTPKAMETQGLLDGMASTAPTPAQQVVWSIETCLKECCACILEAANHDTIVLEEFEKDDDLAMRFVTATSNLRSDIFGIEPLQSYYSAKGIAGNIIPAIATTNAICAGLQILQVFQILKAQGDLPPNATKEDLTNLKDVCYYINCIRNKTRNGMFLTASKLEPPNPNCFVCRRATIPLVLDTTKWTLVEFLKRICKARLGFEAPTVMLDGDIIWEEGEGADTEMYEANLTKHLSDLPCGGIHHGTTLDLEDFTQDLTVQVSVTQKEQWAEEELEKQGGGDELLPFLVSGDIPEAKNVELGPANGTAEAEPTKAVPPSADGDDDVVLVLDDDDDDGDKKPAAKRSAPSESENGSLPSPPPAKRAKISTTNGGGSATTTADEIIEID